MRHRDGKYIIMKVNKHESSADTILCSITKLLSLKQMVTIWL